MNSWPSDCIVGVMIVREHPFHTVHKLFTVWMSSSGTKNIDQQYQKIHVGLRRKAWSNFNVRWPWHDQ